MYHVEVMPIIIQTAAAAASTNLYLVLDILYLNLKKTNKYLNALNIVHIK